MYVYIHTYIYIYIGWNLALTTRCPAWGRSR